MKTLKLIILISGIAIMNAVFAETNYNKPQFTLEFNIYGTGAEIYLNDISVYYHDAQGQTSSQKPIPELIIDGENILTIKSFPLKDDNNEYLDGAFIEAIVSVREKDTPVNNNKTILQLKLNPMHQEDKLLDGSIITAGENLPRIVSHSKNSTIAEQSTEIKSPFPRWAWQDGQNIDNSPENFNSLLKKYKEVWDALKSNDIERTTKLYDPAAEEFALAYYYKEKKHGHRIMNTGGFIDDSDWTLADTNKLLNKMPFHLNIFANGKLANIIDTKHKKSPILYIQKKSQNISFYKFSFYKNIKNEWIMIR